ncbi:ABC transporter substrate-binding protein [Dictyobacter aurantiacus]|uniref:Peptide ABC transporter substrate-binding protein n=1 Tax=Dictyobacter aurantiacus TaxID=1936993 RepID=A0A401ZSP6_9CHLR|nr:ABC transporter substrate-binding protein [Dictyobacter aurantiacus]GCE09883.1 peptide ABC transporter substrate-binding protein [Dictyobacter aurantiacus]
MGEVGDEYIDNFNPYASASGGPPADMIYESLLFTNYANGTMNPWLATKYQFSDNNKQLTFTLKDNVKWNDNQPFTSKDVKFTLDAMKQYPGMDVSAIWKYLTDVTAPDDHTVTLHFKTANTPMLWYLGRLQMLPAHIWSKVGDPTKYVDKTPVGTGPFKLKTFTPQMVTLTKNTSYWQPGKPAFNEINYPIYKSNDTLVLQLISNKLDMAQVFTPNLERNYVQKDPTNHHFWLYPNATLMFYPNNAKKPFNQVAVRKAISQALDRSKMSKVAENGYMQVANPTALILPAAKDYLAPEYANLSFKPDVQQAKKTLEDAGYTLGKDGVYVGKDGTRLSFKIDVPNSYSDEILLCQVASQNLKAAGIDASVNTLSYTDWYNNKQNGQYDITVDSDGGGLTPYYYYNRTLNSARSAPIGTSSQSNFARWQDPHTDALLNQYAATSDQNVQKQTMQGIEKIFVEQVPTIPLLDAPVWFEYNSSRFTGWPSKDNPYVTAASPLQIMLAIKPR